MNIATGSNWQQLRIAADIVYVGRQSDEEISELLRCIDCWKENNYTFHQIQSYLIRFQKCYLCCW